MVVVFFYPADFTFVCPTELEDLADNYAEFRRLGVEVYSVSTDTHFSHKAWHATSPAFGKILFPMIGDPTGQISRNFDVLIESEGLADRGTFVVDPDGKIQIVEITAGGIGRNASELLRKIKAAQYVRNHPGEVCPPSGKKARRPSHPRWISSARSDRRSQAEHDSLILARAAWRRESADGASAHFILTEKRMLDANIKSQLKAYFERILTRSNSWLRSMKA